MKLCSFCRALGEVLTDCSKIFTVENMSLVWELAEEEDGPAEPEQNIHGHGKMLHVST